MDARREECMANCFLKQSLELSNALMEKNVFKSNQIIDHFSANPKAHPPQLTIGFFYSHFSKLLAYQSSKNKAEAGKKLGVTGYRAQLFASYARTYDTRKIRKIIGYLRDTDKLLKGMNRSSKGISDAAVMKELVYKILH